MHYSLKISNFKAYNLSLKKENHNSNNINIDPYVKINFGQSKKFKTETINKSITPVWKFEQSLHLPIMGNEELKNRKVELECFDSCFGGDNFIGNCTVDYFTILNGPVHHKLVLRNKGVANGTIEFDLEMSEVLETKLTFRNLKTSYYAGSLPVSSLDQSIEKYLFYYILNPSKLQKITKTLKTKKSKDLVWEDIDQIIYQTGLKELLICPIVFNVLQFKNYNGETDPSLGQITITLNSIVFDTNKISGPALGGVDQKMVSFVEPIIHQSQVVGIMEGEIYFENVSPYIQLTECVHTETGIQSFAGTNYPIPNQQQQQQQQQSFTPIPQSSYIPQQQQPQQQSPPQSSFIPQQTQPIQTPVQTQPQQPIQPQVQQPQVQPVQPQAQQPQVQPVQPQVQQQVQQQPQVQKYQGAEWTDPRLPSGWVIRQDSNTGKQYYVDHNTKTTHWDLPANLASVFGKQPPVNPATASSTVKPVQPVQPVQPIPQGYVYPQAQVALNQQPNYQYQYPPQIPQQQQILPGGYVYPQYYNQYPPATYMMSYPSSSNCHHHHC